MRFLNNIFSIGVCLCFFAINPAYATVSDTNNWTGTQDNSWSVSENWDTGHIPAKHERVVIAQGELPVIYDDINSTDLNYLTVDNQTLLLSGTYRLNAFLGEVIGLNGRAVLDQTGGVNSIGTSEDMVLGVSAAAIGQYNLSNGELTAGYEYIGSSGRGIFNQISGVNNVAQELFIGFWRSGSGEYNLNGGVLNVAEEHVGENGSGTFNHAGGVHNVTSDLVINAQSAYNMNGGTLTAGKILNNGRFETNGGTVAAPLLISGNIINNGTFSVIDSNVSFNGAFQNNGAFISDPSTVSFSDLYIGTNGYLTGEMGDSFLISGKFENLSMRSDAWDTEDALLGFTGALGHDYILNDVSDDFTWGALSLVEGAGLNIIGDNEGRLVFRQLVLGGGVEQLAMINSGYNLYFDEIRDGNGDLITLDGGSYQLAGGGSIVVTPEPASMLLFGLGGAAMAFARRKKV